MSMFGRFRFHRPAAVPALGLAMASPSGLMRRLDWIEQGRRTSRCLLGRGSRWGAVAVLVALAGLFGSVELTRRAVAQDETTRTGSVEVTVLARDTGQPLEGATVKFHFNNRRIPLKTDREGKVRFETAGMLYPNAFWFDAWADGYVQQRHSIGSDNPEYPTIPERVTATLWPGEETLGGRVVDERGAPIAGVTVETWGSIGEKKDEREAVWHVTAITDGQGQWRCRCFRKTGSAQLFLSHPEYVSDDERHPRTRSQPNPADSSKLGGRFMAGLRDFSDVQVMARGVGVGGRVVDARDRPVVGAEIRWIEADRLTTLDNRGLAVRTDEAGRFRFRHAQPGQLALLAKATGHAPELQSIEAGKDSEDVLLRLGIPQVLTGKVIDPRGKPIFDAHVYIDSWRGTRGLGMYAKTDAEGRYRWDDAPADAVMVNAGKIGFTVAYQRRVVAGEGEVTFTLNRAVSVRGPIRDAATGARLEGATAIVAAQDPATGEFDWTSGRKLPSSGGELLTFFDSESAPIYRIRITAEGYGMFESRSIRSDEGEVKFDVKLAKLTQPTAPEPSSTPPVFGIVHRPDGTPLVGAEVVLAYPRSRSPAPPIEIVDGVLSGPESARSRTDAEGRFAVPRQAGEKGPFAGVLVVHPEFFAELDRATFEANPTIETQAWGRIEGVARIGARPVAGIGITSYSLRRSGPPLGNVQYRGTARADDAGRFVLERVRPGEVQVRRGWKEYGDRGVGSAGTIVDVEAGRTTAVELGGVGRPVTARIALPQGFPPEADYTIHSTFTIESDRPDIPMPEEIKKKRDGSSGKWLDQWWNSPEGRAYRRAHFAMHQAKLQPDGTIRAEDVPPGKHRLTLTFSAERSSNSFNAGRIGDASITFTVPEGRSDEPLDLGELTLHVKDIRLGPE